jgi:hypothetical protein
MPNYGDVALNLPHDWSRTHMVGDPSFILTTIGHEGGKADARLEADPERRHQFRWCAPNDTTAISTLRSRHYEWVLKSTGWVKNPNLWEWDGEGYIIHNGQRLMARDATFYVEEQAENDRRDAEARKRRSMTREEEDSLRAIEARGATIEDEQGRQLRPVQPQNQSGKTRR